jgi:EAL domain-containing protein (putative c-di-GMP-specific phosphodiesterase class I)
MVTVPPRKSPRVLGGGASVEALDEDDRLESLRSYGVLDTEPEPAYDELTALAAFVCSTPMALVSLVDADRQWFKSRLGLEVTETPRDVSFCTHAVASGNALVVGDATRDARFMNSQMVAGEHGLRAYAGVPLVGRDGLPLGTLCVLDRRTRRFSSAQLSALATVAKQVVNLLELRRLDNRAGRSSAEMSAETLEPTRLRLALERRELVPWFQPVVDLETGLPKALEALVRWEHPQLGMLAPAQFLAAIEHSGLILPVGRYVLREALRMFAECRADRDCPALTNIAVNVSFQQLAQAGIAKTVCRELAAHHIPAEMLTLELTESIALHDDLVAGREMQALQDAGVKLSIDDYGTGYSSLMRVLELPITELKLDRTLTQRLPHDRRAMSVARSTIDMATDLELAVIAEGVETQEQRETLLQLGCRAGQGFLFSRPLQPDAVRPALIAWE